MSSELERMMESNGIGGSRSLNRLRVIQELYRRPQISRADLAALTGLSRATISNLVDELGRAGIVSERDERNLTRPSATGRPPLLLSLVQDAAFAVGIDLGHRHIRIAVCDLSGQAVADASAAAIVDYDPAGSLDRAATLVETALNDLGLPPERLIGVGMGLPTPIDAINGDLEAEGILPGWQGVSPAREMERRLGLHCEVDNDANLGALGEKLYGAGRSINEMIYVRLSAGIGAGLIFGGEPYSGSRGFAGEIGHVLVREEGLICRCGNRGCLETVASPLAICGLLEQSLGQEVDEQHLMELIGMGHRGACRAVADGGDAVGKALATYVNMLNPELIVVGGDLSRAGSVLLEPIRSAIRHYAINPTAVAVRVEAGALGDRAEVLGAAAMILTKAPRVLVQRLAE